MKTLIETIKDLKQKKVSITELVGESLKSVEKNNKIIKAFVYVNRENALKDAKVKDAQLVKEKDPDEFFKKYPLFGIPIAHKELFSTKDITTTAGSNIIKDYIPPYNATVVEKLEKAGAINIGKLNCDAFAHGTTGENSDFYATLNPYDLSRPAGGSSSGSAASVAAKMVYAATATDTGGSVRDPASFTNTTGIKPTYGRVSRYGVIAMASSTDSIGHITNNVEDNAYVLNVTAGYDKYDATSSKEPVKDYTESLERDIKGLRIGIPKEYVNTSLNKEVLEAANRSIESFKRLGAEIIDISLPNSDKALAVYYILVPSEISSNLARFDGLRYGFGRERFGDEAKRRIMIGTYTLSAGYYDAYYKKAQQVRTLIIKDFKSAFDDVDVILGPAMPLLPPKIGQNLDDPLKNYLLDILTCPINIAGLPALSVPAGFSKEGLPIGIQLIGNYFSEELLYNAGYKFQELNGYYKVAPKMI